MNYQKIDAWLLAELGDKCLTDEPDLLVFVRMAEPPDDEQKEELKRLGMTDIAPGRTIFSGQISSQAVSELSDKPWVSLITLSKRLEFLG